MPVVYSNTPHGKNEPVRIRGKDVGTGHTYVIAEIGINHDGSRDLARHMIDVAAKAGADAIKFQKRTVDVVYSMSELSSPRESWYGHTNGDLKRGLEFSIAQYGELGDYAHEVGLAWGASCWDVFSVKDVAEAQPDFLKIASPQLTDPDVLAAVSQMKRDEVPVIMSTGMSTMEEVRWAFMRIGYKRLVLMHCVSSYPVLPEHANLRAIRTLQDEFQVPVGYSGHEENPDIAIWAAAMGASCIERHFTLDRRMWGSDQKLSINGDELAELVYALRCLEAARGTGEKVCQDCEKPAMNKLRKVQVVSG